MNDSYLNTINFNNTYSFLDIISKPLNAIEIFKKGNKIKIKKKNIGSFTRYCGGNVTLECINKGKNSSSSKIRKKAIFAENSRKWNHK